MKIVATSPSFSKNKLLQKEIYNYFPDAKLNLNGVRFNKDELIDFIKDAHAIIVGLEPINKEVLSKCKDLKIVSKYGVGLDNIDLKECKKRDIKIGWTGGINKLSVAEMTIGFMLMLSRNLFMASNQLKNGVWKKDSGFELSYKTIGVIGVGNIGKEVIRLLKPFNCKILVNDIIDQDKYYEENSLIKVSKNELYKYSDIITIHNDKITHNMIDLKVLKTMKKSAYILNTSRGGIINEADLKYALKNGIIAGAAIDSYIKEPPTDEELLNLPNLICTPHMGGNSQEGIEATGMSAIKHIRDFFNK